MPRNVKFLPLTILLLGILLISGISAILTSNAKALPGPNSFTNTQSLRNNNSTSTDNIHSNSTSATNILPSAIRASTISQYSTNATYSPPSANIKLTQPPVITPVIRRGSNTPSVVESSPMAEYDQQHWWLIDFWSNTSGDEMPSFMNGTFVAVQNTIGGLSSGDTVIYEPINIAYGTSNNNFVWYQFVVYFDANTLNPDWAIWQFPNGDPNTGTYQWIPLPYIAGHTYNFAYTTSGTNTVTFNLYDTNETPSYQNPYTYPYSAPGLQLLYNTGAYSPASCVEGSTNNTQFPTSLTNVPYFQTYIGYGETTDYHKHSVFISTGKSNVPSGINTGIWTEGSNYYYWSMMGYNTTYQPSRTITQLAMVHKLAFCDQGPRDGNYAYEYGGNSGDGAYIIGQMNALSGGNIYLYGFSDSGYDSCLLCVCVNG